MWLLALASVDHITSFLRVVMVYQVSKYLRFRTNGCIYTSRASRARERTPRPYFYTFLPLITLHQWSKRL